MSLKNINLLRNVIMKETEQSKKIMSIIEKLKNECKILCEFYEISDDIGKFNEDYRTEEKECINFKLLEKEPGISRHERKLYDPERDLSLTKSIESIVNNFNRFELMNLLHKEFETVYEIKSCMTTAVIPTINVIITQLNDFLEDVLVCHLKNLDKLFDYLIDGNNESNEEPCRKKCKK